MAEIRPWEEVPDEAYWRSLLGEYAEQSQAGETAQALSALSPSPTRETDEEGVDVSPSGWTLAEKSYVQGETLELRVIGYNRGGVLVDLGDVRGFVPASQLLSFPRKIGEEERMQQLARYVTTTLRLKVIELDRAHNRLILSERVARPPVSRAEQVIATIQPQQTLKGIIRNVTDFGAFVDLGGVEGLIHVSELSWQHVLHPRDVLAPGQQVDVLVMDVNREQKRIACSLKRLQPNPWVQVAEKLRQGDLIDGVITNVVSFGAFVRIADGVEGLIHVSELAEGNFLHPRDVVHEGQAVKAYVTHIDPARQRIGLSLRGAARPGNGWMGDAQSTDGSRTAPTAPSSDSTQTQLRDEDAAPPPPDAGYWQSLAQSDT